MKEIKYVWNLESPRPPTKLQATLFTVIAPVVLYVSAGTLPAIFAFMVLLILNFKFQSILFRFLFIIETLLFLLIHLFNLVLLTFVFYMLLTPMGFIFRRLKVGITLPTKNAKLNSYFTKSEPLREDYFLKPF